MMTHRRLFYKTWGCLVLCWLLSGCGGTQTIVVEPSLPRVGFLAASGSEPELELLKNGLKDVGYVDGQNIQLEPRLVEPEALLDAAEQLTRLPVKVLIAADDVSARAARVAVLWTGPVTDDRAEWDRASTLAAAFYGLVAQPLEAQDEAGLDAAFD